METALLEDADLIALSVLSGAHITHFKVVVDELARRNASYIAVFGGGIIPEEDIPLLDEIGVAQVFTPGKTIAQRLDERFSASDDRLVIAGGALPG